jgi:hypothetical protein
VGADSTITVGRVTNLGDGRLVGVGSWRTHAINARRPKKNQTLRFKPKYRFTPRKP